MKQSQKAVDDVIKVHVWVDPSIFLRILDALGFVWHNVRRNALAIHVLTLIEFSRKKLNTQNTEYQPEQDRNQ